MPQGCYKMAWGQPGCLSTLAQTGRHTPQFSVFCSVLFCFNYETQAACVTSVAAGCGRPRAGAATCSPPASTWLRSTRTRDLTLPPLLPEAGTPGTGEAQATSWPRAVPDPVEPGGTRGGGRDGEGSVLGAPPVFPAGSSRLSS